MCDSKLQVIHSFSSNPQDCKHCQWWWSTQSWHTGKMETSTLTTKAWSNIIDYVLFYKLWLEFYRLPEADVTCPRALTWISQKHVTKELGAEHSSGKGNGGHLSPHSHLGSTGQNQTSLVCLFDSRTLPPPFKHKVAKGDLRGQVWHMDKS